MGHLNLLKNAKGFCDKLIVGVTVDELVKYKGNEKLLHCDVKVKGVKVEYPYLICE